MKYSFLKGLTKGVINLIIFSLPFIITSFPEYTNLTIGAVGYMFVNYLKIKYKE